MGKFLEKNWIEVLSLVIAIVSSCFAYAANLKSEEANRIANSANILTRESRSLEELDSYYSRITTSTELTSKIYNETIASSNILNKVFLKLKNKESIKDKGNLTAYLNKFEYLGSLYCDGLIADRHITSNFGKSFNDMCSLPQVQAYRKDSSNKPTRNGLAILCDKFGTLSDLDKPKWEPDYKYCKRTLDEVIGDRKEVLIKYGIDKTK